MPVLHDQPDLASSALSADCHRANNTRRSVRASPSPFPRPSTPNWSHPLCAPLLASIVSDFHSCIFCRLCCACSHRSFLASSCLRVIACQAACASEALYMPKSVPASHMFLRASQASVHAQLMFVHTLCMIINALYMSKCIMGCFECCALCMTRLACHADATQV